jgi:hypothetical protein
MHRNILAVTILALGLSPSALAADAALRKVRLHVTGGV